MAMSLFKTFIAEKLTFSNLNNSFNRLLTYARENRDYVLGDDGEGSGVTPHDHEGTYGKQLTGDALAALSVKTANIDNLAVTSEKLASNSVITAKILNANVTLAKLALSVQRYILSDRIKNAELVYEDDDNVTISFPWTEPGGTAWANVTRLDISENVARGGNVKDGTTKNAVSTWYYLFMSNSFTIAQPVANEFIFKDVATAETEYTLIGAIYNNSSKNILEFKQHGRFVAWTIPVYDLNNGTSITYATLTLTIPKIALNAQIRTYVSAGTAGSIDNIGLSVRPVGTSWNDAESRISLLQIGLNGTGDNCNFLTTAGDAMVYTNTSQQVEYKIISDGTTLSVFIYTIGYWVR